MRVFIAALAVIVLSAAGLQAPVAAQAPWPDSGYDWCYTFDFTTNPHQAEVLFGEWQSGLGYTSQLFGEDQVISIRYSQAVTVAPERVIILLRDGAFSSGIINVDFGATAFGLTTGPEPIRFTMGGDFPDKTITLLPFAAGQSGNTMDIGVIASQQVYLDSVLLFGNGASPFPFNECASVTATATSTAWLPSTPTTTPTPTIDDATEEPAPVCVLPGQPTPTPTPTDTATPGPTPTPTDTPTPSYYLGAVYEKTVTYDAGNFWVSIEIDIPAQAGPVRVYVVETTHTVKPMQSTLRSPWVDGSATFGPGTVCLANPVDAGVCAALGLTRWDNNVASYISERGSDPWRVMFHMVPWSHGAGTVTVRVRPVIYGIPPSTPTPSPTPWPICDPTETPEPSHTPTPYTLTPTPSVPPTQTPWIIYWPTPAPTRTPNPTVNPTLLTPPPGPTSTPVPTTTAAAPPTLAGPGTGTGGSGLGPADFTGITGLGEGIMNFVTNLWTRGTILAAQVGSQATRVLSGWGNATPTAPPSMPQCRSNPLANELCAIWYILQYTVLSGPVGSLIIPVATIVVDLFALFLFIRLGRAVVARLGEVLRS